MFTNDLSKEGKKVHEGKENQSRGCRDECNSGENVSAGVGAGASEGAGDSACNKKK